MKARYTDMQASPTDRVADGIEAPERTLHDALLAGAHRSILVTGPSGCGKTTLCKRVMHEMGASVVAWDPVTSPKLPALDAYFNDTQQRTVVFADDIDVYLATVRGASSSLQASVRRASMQDAYTVLMTSLSPELPTDRSITGIARAVDLCITIGRTAATQDPNRPLAELLGLEPRSFPARTRLALSMCSIESVGAQHADASLCSMGADLRFLAGRLSWPCSVQTHEPAK
jgi:molybdopterin-guanine dinucleotide biosynthesis protein